MFTESVIALDEITNPVSGTNSRYISKGVRKGLVIEWNNYNDVLVSVVDAPEGYTCTMWDLECGCCNCENDAVSIYTYREVRWSKSSECYKTSLKAYAMCSGHLAESQ